MLDHDWRKELAAFTRSVRAEVNKKHMRTDPAGPATRALDKATDLWLSRLSEQAASPAGRAERKKIYEYLGELTELVSLYDAKSQLKYLRARLHRAHGVKPRKGTNIFFDLIQATSAADRRTRSKWARALTVGYQRHRQAKRLTADIARHGGINAYLKTYRSLDSEPFEEPEADDWEDEADDCENEADDWEDESDEASDWDDEGP